MDKTPGQKREDEVLLRMLNTPPKPHTEAKRKGSVMPKAPGSSE
jgi:hypothetical protein